MSIRPYSLALLTMAITMLLLSKISHIVDLQNSIISHEIQTKILEKRLVSSNKTIESLEGLSELDGLKIGALENQANAMNTMIQTLASTLTIVVNHCESLGDNIFTIDGARYSCQILRKS